MGKFYILRYADNWADEMDLDGFFLMTEAQKQRLDKSLELLECVNFYLEFTVGTNQEIEYDSVGDIKRAISIEGITLDQAQTLSSLDLLSTGFAEHFYDYIVEVAKEVSLG